jgi:acyl-CoA thioester hydrolase
MTERFLVRVAARGYEVDGNGHVSGVVFMQYGQHARWEAFRRAGISQERLSALGIGPVSLEETIRFESELRAGDEVDVSCTFVWGAGKTFVVEQELRRPEGTLVATLRGVGGLLDLADRRLLDDPAGRLRALAVPGALDL